MWVFLHLACRTAIRLVSISGRRGDRSGRFPDVGPQLVGIWGGL